MLQHFSVLSNWVCVCVFQKLAAECQSAGYSGTLIPYKCDLSNEEEILSMFSAIKTLHKGVDVCINSAGLAHNEPLLSGRTEGWRNMIDVGGRALWQKQTCKQTCRVYIWDDYNYSLSLTIFVIVSESLVCNVRVKAECVHTQTHTLIPSPLRGLFNGSVETLWHSRGPLIKASTISLVRTLHADLSSSWPQRTHCSKVSISRVLHS